MTCYQQICLTPQGFDPVALTEAVNCLYSLGKSESLRTMEAYYDLARLRTSDNVMDSATDFADLRRQNFLRFKYDLDEQRLFLILRLLFVPQDPTSQMPPLVIGAPRPNLVAPNDWPLFPLVLLNGIPFFMTGGYSLYGVPESPLVHLEYCRKKCVLRPAPLGPLTNAVETVRQTIQSERWKNLFAGESSYAEDECRSMLQDQALRVQNATDRKVEQAIRAVPSRTIDIRLKQGDRSRQATNWSETNAQKKPVE